MMWIWSVRMTVLVRWRHVRLIVLEMRWSPCSLCVERPCIENIIPSYTDLSFTFVVGWIPNQPKTINFEMSRLEMSTFQ